MMSKLPHTGVVRCPSLLAITSLASPWTSGKREGTNVQMSSVSNASVYAVAARGQEKMLLLWGAIAGVVRLVRLHGGTGSSK